MWQCQKECVQDVKKMSEKYAVLFVDRKTCKRQKERFEEGTREKEKKENEVLERRKKEIRRNRVMERNKNEKKKINLVRLNTEKGNDNSVREK